MKLSSVFMLILTGLIFTSCASHGPDLIDVDATQSWNRKTDLSAMFNEQDGIWTVKMNIYQPGSERIEKFATPVIQGLAGQEVAFRLTRSIPTGNSSQKAENPAPLKEGIYEVSVRLPESNDGTPFVKTVSYRINNETIFSESTLVPVILVDSVTGEYEIGA